VLLVAAWTVWAAILVVLGLWVLLDAGTQVRVPWRVSVLGGIAAIAAGMFLFMARVADQVFPAVGQRLSIWLLEMATFLVFLSGFIGAVAAYGGALA
jgi:hypothetical protein